MLFADAVFNIFTGVLDVKRIRGWGGGKVGGPGFV